MATDFDDVLTLREAAETLNLSQQTIRNLIAQHRLTTVDTRFGRLILKDSVTEYQANRAKPGRPAKSG